MGASAPRGAQRNFIWGTRPGGPGEPGTPMDPTEGPGADNPAAIGPAGVIHGSLEEMGRWIGHSWLGELPGRSCEPWFVIE